MRSQGSNAVSWVRNNLSPALSSVLLRASQGTHSDRARPLPPTPTRTPTRYLPEQSEFLRRTPGTISETFPPPPGNWKASCKTEKDGRKKRKGGRKKRKGEGEAAATTAAVQEVVVPGPQSVWTPGLGS
ncbi:UNVERIFIED_CONTAM: hypothetical protein FKN15_060151 [Acipenser sinensis]